jgi:hypothetical protein
MNTIQAGCTEVRCPYCKAEPGVRCTTATGRPLARPRIVHDDRWQAWRDFLRQPLRYRLLEDDTRFGLAAGDVLVCAPYRYDGEKLTVLYRESDGFDPQCNVYRPDVRRIRGPESVPPKGQAEDTCTCDHGTYRPHPPGLHPAKEPVR